MARWQRGLAVGAALVAGAVPIFLVVKAAIKKDALKLLNMFFRELITLGRFLRLRVTRCNIWIQIRFGAAAQVFLNARRALKLAAQ